jgi:pimeloyl-ACP methyl ester carboxylesterase
MHIVRNTTTINGNKLFYLDSLEQSECIFCLHGRWGRAETWFDFMNHYSNRYRIIAPDQRGHGLSDKPIGAYSVEEMALDIIELAKTLDIRNYIIVGHSMGGGIAAYLAANYPGQIKGLAILDKSPNGPREKPIKIPVGQDAVDPISKNWPLPFKSREEARVFIAKDMDSELSREYFENSLFEDVDGIKMMYSSQAISANIENYHEWYDLLERIKCPTVIMRSSSHEAVNDSDFEKMKNEIKDSLAFEIANPDHNVHLGNKNEFYKYFDMFLAKIEGNK